MLPLVQQLLKDAGIGENPDVAAAIDEACYNQTSFVDSVLDCEGVRERDFLVALAHALSLPWWEMDPARPVDGTVRRQLPAELALRYRLLPLGLETPPEGQDEGMTLLHVATCDPLNLVSRQHVAASVNHAIVWHVGLRTQIVEGLQKLYGLGADTFEKILRGRADWAND